MNDRHPSGDPSPDDPGSGFSYGAYDAHYSQSAYGTYGTGLHPADSYDGYATGSYGNEDPLFGNLPSGDTGTGTFDSTSWGTGSYATGGYDPAGYDTGAYDTGSYAQQTSGYGYPAPADGTGQWTFGVQDTGGWGTDVWNMNGQAGGYDSYGAYADHGAYGYDEYGVQQGQQGGYSAYGGYDGYGTYDDGTAYRAHGEHGDAAHRSPETYAPQGGYAPQDTYGGQPDHTGQFEQFGQEHAYGYNQDATGQWSFTQQHEYDTADTWGFPDPAFRTEQESAPGPGAATAAVFPGIPHQAEAPRGEHVAGTANGHADDGYDDGYGYDDRHAYDDRGYDGGLGDPAGGPEEHDLDRAHDSGFEPDAGYASDATPLATAAPHSRGRRRSPKPRRRALMTVAVPSVAVMGVAGAAAASVMGGDEGDKDSSPAPVAAPDAEPVKPSAANSKLDTQLAGLSADADDFADRASRTQERIDLKERQEAERERKAKAAARKEAMRPKYVLPVKDHTLSAQYGQAGVNWMSVHTGIDFPVSYGTSVMAATDGTVSTKYDMSYGNMAIVTAKDGTETWYCHLSSTKLRSGEVKAGDTIAYSGSSGNSTGPHLHFEVRPGGGSAVDPIPWLQDKGLKIG